MKDFRLPRLAWASARDGQGTPFEFTGFTRLVPLVVCGGLFAVSIAAAFIGPIDWRFANPGAVSGFLLACFFALVSGYLVVTLRKSSATTAPGRVVNPSSLVILGGAIFIVLFPFVTQITTGQWFPDVVLGLTNAGEAYANTKHLNQSNDPAVLYVKMLAGPLTLPILPVTLFLWRRLSLPARVVGIICTALSVALNISQGTANGVAEMCGVAILFFGLVIASSFSKAHWRRIPKALVAIALIAVMFVGYYSTIMRSRLSADIERSNPAGASADGADPEQVSATMTDVSYFGASLRPDSIFYLVVPKPIQPIGTLLDNYLTQGYRGLSLAMQEPFTSTYGLGFSEFFRHNILKLTGRSADEKAVVANTYAGKISEHGWPVGRLWASFFVHPAADIGFPGVVALMFLIGLVFGLSWRDLVARGDPLAAAVFVQLCLLLFYLSANNQLFQGGERAIGFTVLLVVWLVLRRVKVSQPLDQLSPRTS